MPDHGDAAIDEVVTKARAAQIAWAALDVRDRVRKVSAVRKRVLQRAEALAKIVHEETGKPEVEALLGEVLPTADVVAHWAETLEVELEPVEAEIDALSYPKKSGLVHREARGVLAVIMPWNFPLALPLRTLVPALMAGNAVVLKPSEVTPRTGEAIAELFAGILPDDLLAVVAGGADAGEALCAADVDAVAFTGSPRAGRAVARACAERLVPCALELGGKDAAIVLEGADLDRAAAGITWGAMMNAGQNCGGVERVYVVSAVAEAFTEKLTAHVKALRVGDEVGPLTTLAQRRIVERHVDAAREGGAEVLVGGSPAPESERGYLPTVVRMSAEQGGAALLEDETFGPVVPVVTVADVEEAVRRANASRYGLTASIWTGDPAAGEALARRLRAGVVTINNCSFTGAIPSVPWGGVGESGWGVTGSSFALDLLTRPRLVLVDRNRARREVWWYPYSPTLRALALALAKVKGGAAAIGARIGAALSLPGLFLRRSRELSRAARQAPSRAPEPRT